MKLRFATSIIIVSMVLVMLSGGVSAENNNAPALTVKLTAFKTASSEDGFITVTASMPNYSGTLGIPTLRGCGIKIDAAFNSEYFEYVPYVDLKEYNRITPSDIMSVNVNCSDGKFSYVGYIYDPNEYIPKETNSDIFRFRLRVKKEIPLDSELDDELGISCVKADFTNLHGEQIPTAAENVRVIEIRESSGESIPELPDNGKTTPFDPPRVVNPDNKPVDVRVDKDGNIKVKGDDLGGISVIVPKDGKEAEVTFDKDTKEALIADEGDKIGVYDSDGNRIGEALYKPVGSSSSPCIHIIAGVTAMAALTVAAVFIILKKKRSSSK
jgi:hypothetical protein